MKPINAVTLMADILLVCLGNNAKESSKQSMMGLLNTKEIRQQAKDKHFARDTNSAILLLTDAIKQDLSNTDIALDMLQILLDTGELEQSQLLFNRLPEQTKKTAMGVAITSQLNFNQVDQHL